MDMLFELLAQHVYLILFISLILEFAALPLPGETMMVVAGVMAYSGHANFWGMILASALGTVIGMQFSYEVGRRLGTRAIDKYGMYIGLTPYRMTKASEFFNKYGNIVIIIAYYLPGVRHILGYFSGITKVDSKRFHLYSTLGGIMWVVTFITLGYVLGPGAHHVFNLMHKYGMMLVMLGAIVLFTYLIYKNLGKRDFIFHVKKQAKYLIIISLLIVGSATMFVINAPHVGPKLRDKILFCVLLAFLIVVLAYYIRFMVKNTTSEKLLVVVDYQKDFVDGALGFEGAEKLEDTIVQKIEDYKNNNQDIIFTKDIHFTNYLNTREGRHIPVEHCILGSEGANLYGKVANYEKDAKKVFEKNTFGSIDLARYVSKSDYKEIEFCGLVSNICVLSNIVLVQNYNDHVEIKVDLEATRSFDEEVNKQLKRFLEQLTVNVK